MGTQILEHILAGNEAGLVRLSVEQYHQMIANGILEEGSQIELLDGFLVLKDRRDRGGNPMNVGSRHAAIVTRLNKALQKVADSDSTHVRCQQPITLPPSNEPEPDVSVVIGQTEDYIDRHPQPADLLAVMEVADSSLRHDRDVKQRIYANAGIAVYWIVDISANHIEIYTQPQSGQGRYGQMLTVRSGEVVSLMLPHGGSVSVPVAEVLL